VVRIALAAHLAVGEDVEASSFLCPNGEKRGVVLSLLEVVGGWPPKLVRTDPRREPPGQPRSIYQPIRLGKAADEGGREQRECFHRGKSCPPTGDDATRRARTLRGPAERHDETVSTEQERSRLNESFDMAFPVAHRRLGASTSVVAQRRCWQAGSSASGSPVAAYARALDPPHSSAYSQCPHRPGNSALRIALSTGSSR